MGIAFNEQPEKPADPLAGVYREVRARAYFKAMVGVQQAAEVMLDGVKEIEKLWDCRN